MKSDSADIKYANWLVQTVLMLRPKNLALVLGRGTGKTTDILAQRSQDICYEMPGCYIALSSDTYMNARKNVVPSLIEGWKRNDWFEDYHFVVNTRPPKEWVRRCYKIPQEYKDSFTIFNGTHIKVISQDRPSTGAGDSYQHVIGDEVKYQAAKKINKLTPAVRGGELKFRKSPYYGGRTFTTDMPNVNHGEHDWILDYEKNMDPKQIALMMQTAFVINEIEMQLAKHEDNQDEKKIANTLRKLERWEERFRVLRKNSTFFHVGSSFINADILGFDFFKDIVETMNFSDVRTSILSMRTKAERGLSFYPNLSHKNFYSDGWEYSRIELMDYRDRVEEKSVDLRYCDPNKTLEAGLDTGNMCSLLIGQDQGKIIRVLKEFYTLPPEFLPEMGKKFREFFEYHKRKELLLYADPASHKYKKVGHDHASMLKKSIEYDEKGVSTGWVVKLMNENIASIPQETEYELCLEMMSGKNEKLPQLLIDQNTCPCYKSSMEVAEKIERINSRTGSKSIHKKKTSERLPSHRLPTDSTNMSDAGKYLLCRPEFLEALSGQSPGYANIPG